MKTFARIEADIVCELLKADQLPDFHPDLEWVDVSKVKGIAEGWTRSGDRFSDTRTPAPPVDELAGVRAERDACLASCDWTQLADSPLDSGEKTAWAKYRQALRDLPKGKRSTSAEIDWPKPPA